MSLKIIKDEDAIWHVEEYDVVLVGTSTYNMLTNGFQNKLKNKYPEIDKANKTTNYGDKRKLGKRLTIEGSPIISLLYICNYPGLRHGPPIDYDALEKAISTANAEFKGKKVMTTMIGCSDFDGNGDKEKVIEILERCGKDMDITIFDYHQMRKKTEMRYIFKQMVKDIKNHKDRNEFDEMIEKYNKITKELYLV